MKQTLKRSFTIKQTQKNFSKFVWIYDFWGRLTEKKAIQEALLISQLNENMNILDIGVGTGQLFEKLLTINKYGFNSGLDLSRKMISKAKEKLQNKYKNYSLVVGNIYNLPYMNGTFNFVISSYVLDLLPEEDFKNILTEFVRVMKDKGEGVIITMSMGKKWYNNFWYLLSKYFPSLLTNCRPIALADYLISAGLKVTRKEMISQNTFASEIIKFKK